MLTAAITSRSTRRVGSFGLLIPGDRHAVCNHRPVIPLVLVVAGGLAVAAGWLLMRRLGPGARLGRIIAATPVVPIARARELAERGTVRYVGVTGRVDAEEPFEDESGRPLVLRRSRLELRQGDSWRAVEDRREVVPFEISEGLDRIAVAGDELDEGLVIVTRESEGIGADIPDRVPPGTPPATPARLRLDLLSSVDHALVLGVPGSDPARGPILRAGLGHPLVLTNLEPAEAMRLMAGGRLGTTRAIGALLAGGVVAIVAGIAWAVLDVLA
jgi:hypothetical protein